MIYIQYNSVKEFSDEVTVVLKKHEIQNNLFFLNIYCGLLNEDNTNMNMITVKDDCGNILLTAIRTIPHPMVIYETDNIPNKEVLEFFTASLIKQNINIDFIMAEKEFAKRFCIHYSKLTRKSFYNNENLVLYLLEKVNKLSLPNGRFRKAEKNDLFYLPYWFADFVPACKLGEWDIESGITNAKRTIDNGYAFIWEDGNPVSLAAFVRNTTDCAFIGQVYTPPHLRGKGYGTACVAKLSQKLFDDGWKYCALYADCTNPYSNKVYQKIGYKEIFYYDQYKLQE